MCQTQ